MLHKDAWLSGFFDKGAYICKPPYEDSVYPEGFVSAKIAANETAQVRRLWDQGFFLVETLITFSQKKAPTIVSERPSIDMARPDDEAQVLAIAEKAFTSSRFYMDKKIGFERASRIKREWVGNFFNGTRGDALYVGREGSAVTGFILMIGNVIDLIAVDEKYKRRGIGRALIQAAANKAGPLKAGTQINNAASISMYQNAGFTFDGAQYVLHRHGESL